MNWVDKYRPTAFRDFWQSEAASLQFIRRAVEFQQVPRLLLITGDYGVGKTTLARVLGRRFSCENAAQHPHEPCGSCAFCREIDPQSSTSFMGSGYFELDVTQNESSHIIRAVQEETVYCKICSRVPHPEWVVCLDEVARVKSKIQEQLLKVVENLKGVLFVFCFSDSSKILSPLRERGTRLHLPKPTSDEAVARVIAIAARESRSITETNARYLCEQASCVPRRCVTLLQNAAVYCQSPEVTVDAIAMASELMRP